MKHSIPSALSLALVLLSPLALQAAHPAGFVDFGKLPAPAGKGQFVEVNVNSDLIGIAAKLTQKNEPDVADLLQGLKAIRVNVVGLDDANREQIENQIKSVRAQLDTDGWQRVVTAQDEKQDVGVYLKTHGSEAVDGVVVTVLDGKKQAVFINVVGDIQVDKLALLGEKFNLDPLKKVGHKLEKKSRPASEEK